MVNNPKLLDSSPTYSTTTLATSPKDAGKFNQNDLKSRYFELLVPSGKSSAQKSLKPFGPYHINHFISYFSVIDFDASKNDATTKSHELTWAFMQNFCQIFSKRNIANARHGVDKFETFDGRPTVEFRIGQGSIENYRLAMIGLVHPDWVAINVYPPRDISNIEDSMDKIVCFYGDTLRRRWHTKLESAVFDLNSAGPSDDDSSKNISLRSEISTILVDHILSFPAVIRKIIGLLFKSDDSTLDKILRSHFLAGTRSWRVGYDQDAKLFYVETIAVERYSHKIYSRFSEMQFNIGGRKESARQDIIELWSNLLANYVNTNLIGGERFSPGAPPSFYKKMYKTSHDHPNIYYNTWEYKNGQALFDAMITTNKIFSNFKVMTNLVKYHNRLLYHIKDIPTLGNF
jgi:hypothetical protein